MKIYSVWCHILHAFLKIKVLLFAGISTYNMGLSLWTTYSIWTRTWIPWKEWSLYWWIITIFYLLSLVETCCFEGQASPHLQHLSLPICCLYDQWWELCHRMIAVSWPSVKVSVMCKAIQRKEGDRFEHKYYYLTQVSCHCVILYLVPTYITLYEKSAFQFWLIWGSDHFWNEVF